MLIGLNTINSNINAQQPRVTQSDFSFVAAGDWGCDEKAQRTVMNIRNKAPDLVLALGDLSYQKSADCWLEMRGPLLNKTKIAIGDHEYHFKNSSRFKQYVDEFDLVYQYYCFNYENIHFLASQNYSTTFGLLIRRNLETHTVTDRICSRRQLVIRDNEAT